MPPYPLHSTSITFVSSLSLLSTCTCSISVHLLKTAILILDLGHNYYIAALTPVGQPGTYMYLTIRSPFCPSRDEMLTHCDGKAKISK